MHAAAWKTRESAVGDVYHALCKLDPNNLVTIRLSEVQQVTPMMSQQFILDEDDNGGLIMGLVMEVKGVWLSFIVANEVYPVTDEYVLIRV